MNGLTIQLLGNNGKIFSILNFYPYCYILLFPSTYLSNV